MRVVVVHAPTAATGPDHDAFAAAVAAARAAGHAVSPIDLRVERFVPVMSPAERDAYLGETPLITEETRRHAELVATAEVLVFVYPTTLTTLPALLRGWLERVFVPGVAFVLDERTNKVHRGLTRVRRIIGIATYADSRWSVLRTRDNGRRVLLRAMRLNTSIRTRTGWVALHHASTATDADVTAFLARVERCMARL
ncbi:MAG: NAD(P)H-dependent oxidoreductase [Acidimicrobiia bacterium]